MSARDNLIARLIVEKGLSAEEAARQADEVYPKSAPRRVVEHTAEIADSVISPPATLARESADVANRVIKGVFKPFKF